MHGLMHRRPDMLLTDAGLPFLGMKGNDGPVQAKPLHQCSLRCSNTMYTLYNATFLCVT